ncbi:MAG TPA: hypothetical protein VNT54_06830 [Solirubrobacteraceae bacterium]|nr:hypothetical protein [Solirubrobacteraceae bacterium]
MSVVTQVAVVSTARPRQADPVPPRPATQLFPSGDGRRAITTVSSQPTIRRPRR